LHLEKQRQFIIGERELRKRGIILVVGINHDVALFSGHACMGLWHGLFLLSALAGFW
jgi:hypothetical protein